MVTMMTKTIKNKTMKNFIMKVAVLAVVFVTAFATTSCQNKYAKKCTLKNNIDSVSYCLGYFEAKGLLQIFDRVPFDTIDNKALANTFLKGKLTDEYIKTRAEQFDTLDVESFLHGFHSMLVYGQGQITDEFANMLCQSRFTDVRNRKDTERKEKANRTLAEGQNFLAENAKKEGVIVTESGLQYVVVKMGDGAKPKETDRVKVLYTGKLIDGTVFDSTDKNNNGEPIAFPLKGVIKAWTEVLQLMPVGSKFTIYAPSELAYGERGAGDKIPGNATLIFDIELVEIEAQ